MTKDEKITKPGMFFKRLGFSNSSNKRHFLPSNTTVLNKREDRTDKQTSHQHKDQLQNKQSRSTEVFKA